MSEENPIPKSEMLNSANSTKNNNKNKKGVEKMSVKESLIAMGLNEKTVGKGGKATRLFVGKNVELSKIVDFCDTEEKYNEVEDNVIFALKTAEFRKQIAEKYPTYKVRETTKKEKKGTKDGISKIIETVNKRFSNADSELLNNFKELLNQIKESNEANKPKKAKGMTDKLKERLASLNQAELFAFVESLKNKQN